MTATAWLLSQLMMAELTSQAEPFQKLWVIKERYRSTSETMRHIAPLQLEDASLFPTWAIQKKIGWLFLRRFLSDHINPHEAA